MIKKNNSILINCGRWGTWWRAHMPCCIFVDKWFIFHDMETDLMVQIDEGHYSGFMKYLASNGYFDHLRAGKNME